MTLGASARGDSEKSGRDSLESSLQARSVKGTERETASDRSAGGNFSALVPARCRGLLSVVGLPALGNGSGLAGAKVKQVATCVACKGVNASYLEADERRRIVSALRSSERRLSLPLADRSAVPVRTTHRYMIAVVRIAQCSTTWNGLDRSRIQVTASISRNDHAVDDLDGTLGALTPKGSENVAPRGRRPRDVAVLSEQRSEDAHDAEEDDDPDDDDADQKEDQKPEATAVTLSYYDHLWWRRGCLAHSGISLGVCQGSRAAVPFRGGLACHLILADGHPGQSGAPFGGDDRDASAIVEVGLERRAAGTSFPQKRVQSCTRDASGACSAMW